MIRQRSDVARRGTDARLQRLDLFPFVGRMDEKRQETPERVGAFTCFRGDLALAADGSQENVEAPLLRRGAAFNLEDRVGQALDLGLEALDEIGEPVDDRLEESDQDGGAALEIGLGAIAPRHIDGERPGLRIAHRDEPLAGENERGRRGSGVALFGGVKQRRRHEVGAVLLVETARGLDLLLLLASRHVEFERALDFLLLGLCGIEEIDPHRFFADLGLPLLARKRAGAVLIDGEHPTSRLRARVTPVKTLYQGGSIATGTMRPTGARMHQRCVNSSARYRRLPRRADACRAPRRHSGCQPRSAPSTWTAVPGSNSAPAARTVPGRRAATGAPASSGRTGQGPLSSRTRSKH